MDDWDMSTPHAQPVKAKARRRGRPLSVAEPASGYALVLHLDVAAEPHGGNVIARHLGAVAEPRGEDCPRKIVHCF